MMDAFHPYMLLAVLLCVLWVAMALGRMPVDRVEPSPTWMVADLWRMQAMSPPDINAELREMMVALQREWSQPYLEPAALDRWADDGGPQP